MFSRIIKSFYVLLHLPPSPPYNPRFSFPSCTMQLSLSFSFLLTTLLFTLAQVEASPTKRSPGMVTLPLKRLSQPSDDHPSIVSPAFDLFPGRNICTHYTSSFYDGVLITPTAAMRGWPASNPLPLLSWRNDYISQSPQRTIRDTMERSGKRFNHIFYIRSIRTISINLLQQVVLRECPQPETRSQGWIPGDGT